MKLPFFRSCSLLHRLRRGFAGLGLSACAALAWGQGGADCPAVPAAPTQAETDAGMKTARDRGFLWRIYKDGRTSFLYGTIHVGQADWAYPGPRLQDALRASSIVALEMDMLDPATLQGLQASVSKAPQRPLPQALTKRLKAQLQAACLPEQMLSAMSPELLATTLVVMSTRRDGLDAAWGIDNAYARLARGLQRPVVSLESPAQQIGLLQGSTQAETIARVEEALADLESPQLRTTIRRLATDWAEGRLDDLQRYESWCDCVKTPAQRTLLKRMLDGRNPAMADKIHALHESGERVFAAVGSLHMIGPAGLPALMARRGYRVERVALTPP